MEVGTALLGAELLLLLAPTGDRPVVAAAQHRRHLLVPKHRRPGVVGMLQQQVGVALFFQRGRGAHGARQQPHHTVDHRGGRQFAAGEHEVADRNLLVGQTADAFIEAFVVAAEQHQLVVALRPAPQIRLAQRMALGGHQQHPAAALQGNRLEGGEHRLGFEHHPSPAAIGLVVHLAVAVRRVVAGVVDMELG